MGMGNFMDSKVLALTVLILLIATLVSIGCALLPFWFRLHFGPEDATYGSLGANTQELEIGIFYIFKPNKPGPERTKVLMTSLLAMDKATNLPVVPPMFKIGQVLYTIGVFGTAVSMAGAFILAVRQYASLTGNFGLAFFTLISAVCQVLGVLFTAITALQSGNTWHMMPLENPFRFVIESHPTMSMDWGFYIAIIGAALAIFGTVLVFIEALKVCKSVEGIRRNQRRTKPPEDPYPDIRYTLFSYRDVVKPAPEMPSFGYGYGYGQPSYGYGQPEGYGQPYRQPVVQPHSTPGMVLNAPQQQFFAQPQPSPTVPRYGEYHPPSPRPPPSPQPSDEYKGGFVSRQVDL